MELIKLPSKEELQKGFETVMDYLLSTDYIAIEAYVDKLREQNNNISCDELAKKIIHRKSIKKWTYWSDYRCRWINYVACIYSV